VGGYVWLRRISIPRQWAAIRLESGVSLDDGVVLLCSGVGKSDKILIRSGTYINRYTIIDAHEQIEVGRNCMIGPHCYITDANHGISPGASIQDQPMTTMPVAIEDGVWIGAGATILAGVRLGRGAVIGAGAVVTKDIAADAIAVGVPAREIGQRDVAMPLEGLSAATI
jgi:acetyltransferase-like isoleucine patch superfamily enzyme